MKKITPLVIATLGFALMPLIGQSQSSARYTISITTVWNSTDHGTLPSNPHWSNLVGATHNSNVTLWELGQFASAGIEDVAEVGNNDDFNSEVNSAISNGHADQWLQTPFSPFAAISSATLNDVIVHKNYPLLTLASMIAPSPDWFIGVNSLSLVDGSDDWINMISVDLFVYDAGTEDGNDYSTDNAASNPIVEIYSRNNVAPFNDQKVATLTVILQEVLSDGAPSFENSIQIGPNPANDIVTIRNLGAFNLKSVNLYDMLGNRVFSQTNGLNLDNIELQLGNLQSGLYLCHIENDRNQTLTRKIILR